MPEATDAGPRWWREWLANLAKQAAEDAARARRERARGLGGGGTSSSPEPSRPTPTRRAPPRIPTRPPFPYTGPRNVPDAVMAGSKAWLSRFIFGSVAASFIYEFLKGVAPTGRAEVAAELGENYLKQLADAVLLQERSRRQGPLTRGRVSRAAPARAQRPPVGPGAGSTAHPRGGGGSPMAEAQAVEILDPARPGDPKTDSARATRQKRQASVVEEMRRASARAQAATASSRAETLFQPFKAPFGELVQDELKILVERQIQRSQARRARAPRNFFEEPERPERPDAPDLDPDLQPLTGFDPYRVDSATGECPKPKRRERSSRAVCYEGRYRERASGLTKTRGRKIPCRQSRKKPA